MQEVISAIAQTHVYSELYKAVILGIVEGITEFLPISSSAHIMLASQVLQVHNDVTLRLALACTQAAAILALLMVIRHQIFGIFFGLISQKTQEKTKSIQLVTGILVAFLPSLVCGLAFYSHLRDAIASHKILVIGLSLVSGGFIMLITEKIISNRVTKGILSANILEDSTTGWKHFLRPFAIIGCAQILAFIPGVSRSGSAIVAALLCGLSRKSAVEISFLIGTPTILSATANELYKLRHELSQITLNQALFLAGGCGASFIFALLSAKFLLQYLKSHSLAFFAVYRIIFGLLIITFVL